MFFLLNRNEFVIKTLSCHVFNMLEYLQSLTIGGLHTVIRMCYRMVYWLVFRIDIWMNICSERQRCCVTICFYDFREKWLIHDNPTFVSMFDSIFSERNDFVMALVIFIHFFSFCMGVTCCLHVFHLWYIGNDLTP